MSDAYSSTPRAPMFAALRERYASLPRHLKWVSWLVFFVLAYLIVVEPVMDYTAKVRLRADSLASSIERVRTAHERSAASAESARYFGTPELISKDSKADVEKLVWAILGGHDINLGSATVNPRPSAEVRMTGSGGASSRKFGRAPVEVQFTTEQDVLSEILVDFEKQPKIARIARLEIKRAGRQVQVKMEVESWYTES